MKRICLVMSAFLAVLPFMSCIQAEPENCECDIISAWVEGEEYASYFNSASQMKIENISSTEKELVFIYKPFITLPDAIPVSFTVTDGAVIEPASGSLQNFKTGPLTYTVTSEDGAWHRTYTVSFKEYAMPSSKFSFENAETVKGAIEWQNNYYHEFYELDASGNKLAIWASGNAGAVMMKTNAQPSELPTYQMEQGYSGKALCLNTQYAGDLGKAFGKPIAAGSLYLGSFNIDAVFTDALKSTKFGTPYTKAPLRVTGWYTYKPGEVFTNAKMETVEGRVDEANIYAVFYRNKDADGNDVFLYGDDVLTSDYIVRKAQVDSLPATDEWKQFEMNFDNGAVDAEILANQGYNLTLVFSSSKDGASFEGAVGSTLCVDEVELFFEE